MPERLRIAVTGLAATYPFGGVFWDYIQYPLGFHRLGHDVLYIEDTGRWNYDPSAQTFTDNGRANANANASASACPALACVAERIAHQAHRDDTRFLIVSIGQRADQRLDVGLLKIMPPAWRGSPQGCRPNSRLSPGSQPRGGEQHSPDLLCPVPA